MGRRRAPLRAAWRRLAVALLVWTAPALAAGPAVPVLWQNPTCDYDKLGHVEAQAGSRKSELRRPRYLSDADYRHAFAELAEAAAAQGGNAVVLRWHRPTHFRSASGRSPRPFHIRFGGAVVRIAGDPTQCALAVADADEFQRRYRQRAPPAVRSGAQ